MPFLDKETMELFYHRYAEQLQRVRRLLPRPLTLTEKIIFSHSENLSAGIVRGKSVLSLRIDRVAMQDATAQMAILQFMLTGRNTVAIPTTIHCDHLIQASVGAGQDLPQALLENNEVYQFLKSAASKYGIGFWKPGSGIIHQVVLENYAFPASILLGTDSHTPNAGGVGMVAIGVGGTDAVDVMGGEVWTTVMPKLIGIRLRGKLNGWSSAKDVILKVAEILTVKGGTGCILEYFGEGVPSLSATGRATITNMGAEVGATTSLFPCDERTAAYLRATHRDFIDEYAEKGKQDLRADPEVEQHPFQFYDHYIEIDLSQLEPQINGPHTPDLSRPISKLKEDVQNNNWPVELTAALVGSCTNSSYEDLERAAAIARQAAEKGMKVKTPLLITPGSEQIYKTIQRDGQLAALEQIGATVLANACGPCIGQWKRNDIQKGQKNSILTSYNRNFKQRNDGNPETHAFIASPEMVTALALAGRLDFNPLRDELETAEGKIFLRPPAGEELPPSGFVSDYAGYEEPTGAGEVLLSPASERLAFLEPFTDWDFGPEGHDFQNLAILVKAQGKCTTDQISPAGKWLAYRGHLDKISNNLFSGAVNAFTGETGTGRNVFNSGVGEFNAIARRYKENNIGWVVVGDVNYGEGSSREHAAMEPRYLGCRAVIVKSFARIHEANLKRQGILPLWLVKEQDYDQFQEEDRITIIDPNIREGKLVEIEITHHNRTKEKIFTRHTLAGEELNWFRAGSALNWIRRKNESNSGSGS